MQPHSAATPPRNRGARWLRFCQGTQRQKITAQHQEKQTISDQAQYRGTDTGQRTEGHNVTNTGEQSVITMRRSKTFEMLDTSSNTDDVARPNS